MPTPFLCEHCQLRGTSFQESGKGVTIDPHPDEQVRFFRLDHPVFRNEYRLQEQGVCDLLVEYCRGTAKPVDLFTELKAAGGCGNAVRQIDSAFTALQADLRSCQRGVRFRALIVASASSPPNQQALVKQLMKRGFEAVRFKTGVKRGTVRIREYVT